MRHLRAAPELVARAAAESNYDNDDALRNRPASPAPQGNPAAELRSVVGRIAELAFIAGMVSGTVAAAALFGDCPP